MSDQEVNDAGETVVENDPSSNKSARTPESVLAEANRKIDKIAQENAKLSQQLEQFMARMTPQKVSSESTDVDLDDDLLYKDPKQFSKRVKEQAKQEALQAVNQINQQQQQSQQVLSQLVNDYPELGDTNSELSKKAVDIYKSLPENERSSPLAYKVAVREAAAELGTLPKSASDDFTLNGGSGKGQQQQSKAKDLSEKTMQIAALMGVDINDKKVVDRIKQRAQRKNWGKYE